MLASVNYDAADCQKQPYPDRAVWGGVQQPTTAAILLPVLRLAVLAIFVACGLAMAGAKLSSDLQQQIANADVEVIVQFNRIPTDADLKPFAARKVIRRFRHSRPSTCFCRRPKSGPSNPIRW